MTPTFAPGARAQVAALRAKKWLALDVDNLAEEMRAWDGAAGRAITHQLERLLLHLLKWVYQPDQRARRGRGWRGSVRQARTAIADLFEERPSLRDYLAQRVALAYQRARQQWAIQTGLPLATFPETCPWSSAQLLDEDFWPEDGAR